MIEFFLKWKEFLCFLALGQPHGRFVTSHTKYMVYIYFVLESEKRPCGMFPGRFSIGIGVSDERYRGRFLRGFSTYVGFAWVGK